MKKFRLYLILAIFGILISACLPSALAEEENELTTPVVEQPTTTPSPPPTPAPPAGYKLYRLPGSDAALYIPGDWVVSSEIPGDYAILQSYPEDKYIGGEGFEPGDTKCDLNILPQETTLEQHLQQWKSDPNSMVVSEETVTLDSGNTGIRLETEGMGRSLAMVTEISERVVTLVCFGTLEPFDRIAPTLHFLN